jgi:hypothetical protein
MCDVMFWMCDVLDVRCVCTDSDDRRIVTRQKDGRWELRRIRKMVEPRISKMFSCFDHYITDGNLAVNRNRDAVTVMTMLVEEKKNTKHPVRVEMVTILGVLLS